jgi:type II secretory pathway predicted ATPase ExeA
MWWRDYGMRNTPFGQGIQGEDDIFESGDVAAVQEAVMGAVIQNEMLAIMGVAGSGKTIGVYSMLGSAVAETGKDLLLITDFNPDTGILELSHIVDIMLRRILEASGSSEVMRHHANARYEQLKRVLGEYSQQHHVVVVVEDAHAMMAKTLIGFKRLFEMRYLGRERLFTLILLAQPQFESKLKTLREVDIRCERIAMTGLGKDERIPYLRHRIERQGGKLNKIFTPGALEAIAQSIRWPQDMNDRCTKILKDGVRFEEIPISAALAKKHLRGTNSLGAILLASGMTAEELRSRLRDDKGINISLRTIMRVLTGHDPDNPDILNAIRSILAERCGSEALGAAAEWMTPVQRKRWEAMRLIVQDNHYDLDFETISMKAKLPANRVHEIIAGDCEMDDDELRSVEREVRRAAMAKAKASAADQDSMQKVA